jgi:hypothetical protein
MEFRYGKEYSLGPGTWRVRDVPITYLLFLVMSKAELPTIK